MPIKENLMNNIKRIIYGLGITIMIFFTARIISKNIPLNSKLVPDTFISLTIILLLSILAIFIMRQGMWLSFSTVCKYSFVPRTLQMNRSGSERC